MATQTIARNGKVSLLRGTLAADGLFEVGCAAACLLATQPLSAALGLSSTIVTLVGIGLLPAAGLMLWLASQQRPNLKLAQLVAFVNADFALLGAILVLMGWWPAGTDGKWIVGILSLDFAIFAALEFLGVQRSKQAEVSGR